MPAFLTMLAIPLTFSIANGLAFGFTAYTLLHVLRGRFREVNWMVYVLTALFLVRFYYLFLGTGSNREAFRRFKGHQTRLSYGVSSIQVRVKPTAYLNGYYGGHSRDIFNHNAFQFHEGIYKTYGKVARIYGFFGVRQAA